MQDHFLHHQELLWALVLILIMIAKDYPVGVEAKERERSWKRYPETMICTFLGTKHITKKLNLLNVRFH